MITLKTSTNPLFVDNTANPFLPSYQARNRGTQSKGQNIVCLGFCFARNNTNIYD